MQRYIGQTHELHANVLSFKQVPGEAVSHRSTSDTHLRQLGVEFKTVECH
jgi:hypothetical protein